jgi:glycosyltransferase involved in cell wall biosynthesis
MKVGVALHYVREGKITGVERLGLCLAAGLAELQAPDIDIDVLASATAATRISERGRLRTTTLPGDWRLLGEQAVLPAWCMLRGLDLLHVPAFGGPLLHRRPFVLTIHDAVFWDLPATLSRLGRTYYRPLVERAIRSRYLRATMYPSAAARDRVLHHFPALAGSAHVCHNATPFARTAVPRRWHEREDGPFRILTVGTIEPRKNLPAMAAAISELMRHLGRPVRWQIVGRKGWAGAEEERALRHPSVEWLGMIEDHELLHCYKTADLYLSLSHLEGFNMPVVEAMAQGTPAILSALAVHQEIAGAGAQYVAADDPAAAGRRMYELVTDAERWSAQADAAWQRAQMFTPKALAARVIDVYRTAC